MKRIVLFLCAIVLGTSIYSAETEFLVNGTTYTIIDAAYKRCELSGYQGSAAKVVIGKTVMYKKAAWSVLGISTYAFSGDELITSVTGASTTSYVGPNAFEDCVNLKSVNLPGVENISDNAFAGCESLTTVTLGSKLSEIAPMAFSNCVNLSKITLGSIVPPTFDTNTFQDVVTENVTLVVPAGTGATYMGTDWGAFFPNIEEVGGGAPSVSGAAATTSSTTLAPSSKSQVTLQNGSSLEIYDSKGVLLETIKMSFDGQLSHE